MSRRTNGRAGVALTALVIAVKGRACWWCACPATTRDHWPIPHAAGGPDTLDNLVPACRPCNSARHDRPGPPRPCRVCNVVKHAPPQVRGGWLA